MSERDRDADRKRDERRQAREVVIPRCADLSRRLDLESDDERWLLHYFPDLFWYKFTNQQRDMIAAIRQAITSGDDQSIAASRGEGKTKLAERVLLKYTLCGAIKFSVLFAATGSAAQDSLQSIMSEIEQNDRLLADYPEICAPVRALENTPNRAHYQVVTGHRHDNGEPFVQWQAKYKWCGQEVFLPSVPGAPASGAIVATRGLDSAVRGLSKKNRRPDVAVIDDPDTEETAASEEQSAKLEKRIDRGIAGLGGQRRTIARVMLTTLQGRISASFRFTDVAEKPSWKGKRFRFLMVPPTRLDLWEEYVSLRKSDWREGTNLAHELYVANREAMDAGAVVANPNRYTTGQLSALQFYYDQVARIGPVAVATEYDNDPPEDVGPLDNGISPRMIQRQVSGFLLGIIPPGCVALTQGVDVGKSKLHYVVRAWRQDGTGFTIDYGTQDVHDTKYGSDEGLDRAIKRAILRRMDLFREANYCFDDGEQISDPLTLVDARYRTDAVYAACLEIGKGIYPVMGIGASAGCIQGRFRDVQQRTAKKKPGDGWFMEAKGKLWVITADTDRWKLFEHDRWLTARDHAGCMSLYGEPSETPDRLSTDERFHGVYAQHICSEVEVEELHKGAIRRRWKTISKENHWLDASYYSDVAANLKGIQSLKGEAASKVPSVKPGERPTLAQLAGRK